MLAFHNVVPDDMKPAGERSLHVPQSTFGRFLDVLTEFCEVVAVDDVLNGADERPDDKSRPTVAITFDDAYEGALTCGLAELTARNLPATYFVAPGFIGGETFWWDELAEAYGGVLPLDVRARALSACGGMNASVRKELATSRPHLPSPLRAASEDTLAEASRHGGITFGSHTWGHPNLCTLGDDQLANELDESLNWLTARFPNARRWLSYPYGLANESVRLAAEESGYHTGFAISGGWIRERPNDRTFDLPRLNIPAGLTWKGLALRVSGM